MCRVLHGTRGDGCDGVVPRMHLVEERMCTTNLRFSSCFGVVLTGSVTKTEVGMYSCSWIEFRINLVQ